MGQLLISWAVTQFDGSRSKKPGPSSLPRSRGAHHSLCVGTGNGECPVFPEFLKMAARP